MAVYEATEQTLDELINTEYAVVDFYSDHCGACVYMKPFFEQASNEMSFINFVCINVSAYGKVGAKYNIMAYPTILFMRNGEIVHKYMGGMNRKLINENIAKLLYE